MKRKGIFCLSLAALLGVSMLGLAACGEEKKPSGTQPGENEQPTATNPLVPTSPVKLPKNSGRINQKNWEDVSVAVHDPSVFYDEASKLYYAFGSHFMVASSPNLIDWTQVVGDGSSEQSGQTQAQKLYGNGVNWRTVLSQSVEHAGTTMPSTWAPDVNYHDGKYYMYVSLTSGFGQNKSVICRVSSDNVTGPYSNEEIIVKTPGTAGTPNAIDPELFTDKDGKLWMVYGSHFAGVYIKELYNEGANWGLPKESGENDFGKLLWKGGAKVVEGPFIFYNDANDYYYLMTTYGDLNTDYNMRVARSKNPDGPYVDAEGNDMAETTNNGTEHGVQIAGNYRFARATGAGYAALGHNSVVKDKDGRYFVVYHTRRQSGSTVTAGHNIRVSQLFFNEDNWPVMSPNGYAGEKAGTVEKADLQKTFEVVLHHYETDATSVASEDYVFTEAGKVTKGGAEVGTWELDDNGFYVRVTIGEETYKGVVAPGWDMYSRIPKGVLSITATSDKGHTLWAIEK